MPIGLFWQIHNYHIRELKGPLGIISKTRKLRPKEIKGMPDLVPERDFFGRPYNALYTSRVYLYVEMMTEANEGHKTKRRQSWESDRSS